jgi:hypothetical protein
VVGASVVGASVVGVNVVGAWEGFIVGLGVGFAVGFALGFAVGFALGFCVVDAALAILTMATTMRKIANNPIPKFISKNKMFLVEIEGRNSNSAHAN